MFLAVSRFEIHIPGARSLKARRSVVSSIKERARARFRAAVSEVGPPELWQRATLGVALVGTSPGALASGLAAVRRLVEENASCHLLSWEGRVLAFADLDVRFARAAEEGGTASANEASANESSADQAWYETEEDDEVFGAWDRVREEEAGREPADDGEAGQEVADDEVAGPENAGDEERRDRRHDEETGRGGRG